MERTLNVGMMTWYFYLNYRIYKFYERKRDSIPGFFSFSATMVLLSLNIFSILGILGFAFNEVYDFIISLTKYSMLGLFFLIGLFNYLILYRGKYYEEVFTDFDKYEDRYRSWKKSVPIYIISSIVLLLVVLAIADYRHDGHF